MKTSKKSVEALKKGRWKNVSKSKQLDVEKPDIINILEISGERQQKHFIDYK